MGRKATFETKGIPFKEIFPKNREKEAINILEVVLARIRCIFGELDRYVKEGTAPFILDSLHKSLQEDLEKFGSYKKSSGWSCLRIRSETPSRIEILISSIQKILKHLSTPENDKNGHDYTLKRKNLEEVRVQLIGAKFLDDETKRQSYEIFPMSIPSAMQIISLSVITH